MAEVDPNPQWAEMRRLPRKLFRKLGALRDAQIMSEWVKEHGGENDRVRAILTEHFSSHEPELLSEAQRAAEKFDEKRWKRLDRKLQKRLRLVPPGSQAAECLAVERLEEARDLHVRAVREQKPEAWHELRIGIKKFRYTVECLLPMRYAEWSGVLKQLQDTLGEIHDLDVLSALLREKTENEASDQHDEWQRKIERERDNCLDQYSEIATGRANLWNSWAEALPSGKRAQASALARIRVTARAAGSQPRRAAQIHRIATAIFHACGRARVTPLFREPAAGRLLRAAGRLSGVRAKGGAISPKELCRFLQRQPTPPGWTREEWETLCGAVRYQRGPEPKLKARAFAELTEQQQQTVLAIAGLLRLARGLRRCGVQGGPGFQADRSAERVQIEVPGLLDSVENAARLAVAKHLLEGYLALPVNLKSVTAPIAEMPGRKGPAVISPSSTLAAASD